uniref:Uncharacterized protein n=1 Tax=Arundo donax TaxID=35708 RepID=A0A0A9GC31_ARUDO
MTDLSDRAGGSWLMILNSDSTTPRFFDIFVADRRTFSMTSFLLFSSISLTSISRCDLLGMLLIAPGCSCRMPTVPTVSVDPDSRTCFSTANANSAAASPASFLAGMSTAPA